MNGWILIVGGLILLSSKRRRSPLGNFSPVDQTVSGRLPSGELTGNCFPACIASILGLPLNEVPFFSTKSQRMQLDQASNWLKRRGVQLVHIPGNQQPPKDTYYMAQGKSPRFPEATHMVVGRNGRMVHDPHPDRRGIIGKPISFIFFTAYG